MSATEGEEKRSPWIDGLSGGLGGVVSKSTLCPLQRVVVLKQLGDRDSALAIARKIMKEGDGIKAFWRGNLTAIMIRFPYSGSQLIIYDSVKHRVQEAAGLTEGSSSSFWGKFLSKGVAGAIAASISGSVVYPLEVIRTRLMSGKPEFRTITGTARAVWAENHSPKSFYKGLTASLSQRVPDILLNFAIYESVFYEMKDRDYPKPACIMGGSTVAALTAIAVSFPLDVCKRKMQMGGYKNMADCLRQTYKNGGIGALYSGAVLESVRCVPQVGMMWFTIEFFRDQLTAMERGWGGKN